MTKNKAVQATLALSTVSFLTISILLTQMYLEAKNLGEKFIHNIGTKVNKLVDKSNFDNIWTLILIGLSLAISLVCLGLMYLIYKYDKKITIKNSLPEVKKNPDLYSTKEEQSRALIELLNNNSKILIGKPIFFKITSGNSERIFQILEIKGKLMFKEMMQSIQRRSSREIMNHLNRMEDLNKLELDDINFLNVIKISDARDKDPETEYLLFTDKKHYTRDNLVYCVTPLTSEYESALSISNGGIMIKDIEEALNENTTYKRYIGFSKEFWIEEKQEENYRETKLIIEHLQSKSQKIFNLVPQSGIEIQSSGRHSISSSDNGIKSSGLYNLQNF